MIGDPLFWALAALGTVFAGVSKGGFGSGASFAGAAILALAVEPRVALGVMLPLLMLMDVTALHAYWRRWNGAAARRLILGAAPGVAAGALLVSRIDADALRVLIGAVAIGFVAWRIAVGRGWLGAAGQGGPLRPGPAGLAWGAAAGFTSFVSHAGGPPAAVWLLSLRLSKTEYQATTVIVFFVVNLLKVGPYAALGAFDAETLLAGAVLAPLAVAGIRVGVWLHRRVAERLFFGITYVLLTLTGARLILDGLG